MSPKPLLVLVFLLGLFSAHSLFEDKTYVSPINTYSEYIQKIYELDHLSSFLFYREDNENCEKVEPMFQKFGENMDGLVKLFAVDCDQIWSNREDRERFPGCNPTVEEALPYIAFFEPPTQKINPYTKQPMNPVEHRFDGAVSPKHLGDFAKKYMPLYGKKITSKQEFDTFLEDQLIPNKVVLFTNRDETSPLYKGITSEFRDRLDFVEVHENQKEVCKRYSIDKFPTLLLLEKKEDGTYEKEVYESELRFDRIKRFLKRYALPQKVVREQPKEQAQAEAPKKEEPKIKLESINASSYEAIILDTEKLVLVHVYKHEQHPIFNETLQKFQGLLDYYNFDLTNPENEKFASEHLSIKNYPSFIIYPLSKTRKRTQKYTFTKNIRLSDLTQEISDIIDDKTTSLYLDNANSFLQNAIASKKPSFIIFYEGKDFSMSYRALTQSQRYSDKFLFANFRNPTPEVKQQFNLNKLPTLIVIFLKDPDNEEIEPSQNIQVAHFTGRYNWLELGNFLDMFVPPEDKLIERNLKIVNEINTKADFDNYCVKRDQLCIIALVNGDKSVGDNLKKLQDQQEILNKALKRFMTKPVSIMWIDALCHSEVLQQLNYPEEYVPTVISYAPKKKQYSQIIGLFDFDSIVTWVDKVLKGKVSTYDLSEELTISSKECAEEHRLIAEREKQTSSGSSEDDEILREILEEERKKREALEGEFGKKGKKGKKSKSKNADEL